MTTPIFLAESGIYYAFTKSDFIGQSICIILFLFSVAIWVVMVEKLSSLMNRFRASRKFALAFREKRNPLALRETASLENNPAAHVYLTACEKIELFRIDNPGGGRRALNDDEIGIIRTAMEQSVEDEILVAEKRMMFLATAVSASPFLGLFGTVWGITIAFTNLAIAGKADIQTLAPGVSGALLTTVIALVVAIPSLIGYNFINSYVKRLTVQLDSFVEEVCSKFKIEQMDALSALTRQSK